jgi:hypothetical protein
MGDSSAAQQEKLETHTQSQFDNLTAEEMSAFDSFKEKCRSEDLLEDALSKSGDDMAQGICDDGTLL